MRIILRFIVLAAVAALFAWFADRPGVISLDWLGYRIEASLGVALLALAVALAIVWLLWSLVRRILGAPGSVTGYFRGRRARRGHEALSKGLVAVAAGDTAAARRHAQLSTRLLKDDPLSRLLEAQAAQLEGDHRKVRTMFQAMADEPETRLVALRGLYIEARQAGDDAEARKIAERAYGLNHGLSWASSAVLSARALERDWPAVLSVLETQSREGLLDQDGYRRKRAAIHAAQAINAEEADQSAALDLANRGLKLDPGLVPAAVVAARVLIAQGSLRKATKIIERAWAITPHPDLAEVDAHARTGDAPLDRLKRIQDLLKVSAGGEEGAVALARAAIDARDWSLARQALQPFAAERPRTRVCTLMAEIEEGDMGDKGRAREWLARAVRAPRDPLWIGDGFFSETWLPVSPSTGEIGVFVWKAPPEALGYTPPEPLAAIEELKAPEPLVEEPLPPPPAPEPQQPPAALAPPKPVLVQTEPLPEPPSPAREQPPALQLRQPDDPGPEFEPEDTVADPAWSKKLVS